MSESNALAPDQIKKAVDSAKRLRPAYAELLDFYEQIFAAQEDSRTRTHPDPVRIPEDVLAVKKEGEFSLINISDFAIDSDSAAELLSRICDIGKVAKGEIAASATAIKDAVDAGKLEPKSLFHGLLEEDDQLFEKIAEELGIEKKALVFAVYSSIKPSLSLCAAQLSSYLDKDGHWGEGCCPVCGSPPGLAMLQGEGERFLFCGFCWHKWPARRIYCPFCGNKESKTLHYFYSEEEKDYRVDVCDKCKKYIKTVDARKADRILYPPLEQVLTLHLDMKAKEMGLESGIQLDPREGES